MACGSLTKCEGVIKNSEVLEEDASLTYELSVEEGKTYVFEKMIGYTCDFDIAEDKMIDFIKDELKKAMDLGYDEMEKLQKKHMDEFWSKADIKVEGDEALQQGIRFNLFHIMQSAGRDGRTGMGAKGLSGEGYEGHYFWDTEMYVLPVFIYTESELAKQL